MSSDIGHNNPPDMTVTATETTKDLSAWMAENPVIETEDSAKTAKVFLDRGKLCVKDLEDERYAKVDPLNKEVKEINSHYKGPRETLEQVTQILSQRLTGYLKKIENERLAAAAEARRIADEAEQKARAAIAVEHDAIESVNGGELGVDVAAIVVETNDALRDAGRAARMAAIAQRDTNVKIAGGFSRSISLKTKETLIVTDHIKALTCIGLTEDIREAIIKSARSYRKLRGSLPDGVSSETREEI